MMTFLAIVGSVALAVVVLAIAAFVWLRHKFRQVIAAAEQQVSTPVTITLTADADPEWISDDTVEQWAQQFDEAGFKPLGTFRIEEMHDTLIRFFYHEPTRVLANISEHPGAPMAYVDTGVYYTDGSCVCLSTLPTAGQLDQAPGVVKKFVEADELAPLLEKMQSVADADRARFAFTAENVSAMVEKFYAEETSWRLSRGGTTLAEVRRLAGDEVDEDDVQGAYEIQRAATIETCRTAAIEGWAKANGMSAAELDEMDDLPMVITEFMTRDEVVEALEYHLELNSEQQRVLESLGEANSPFGLLLDHNLAAIFPNGELVQVAQVQKPMPAMLYSEPSSQSLAA